MLLVKRRMRIRRMRFIEFFTYVFMLWAVYQLCSSTLLSVVVAQTSGGGGAVASASPSPHSAASAGGASPSGTASPKSSSSSATNRPSKRICPIDNSSCTGAALADEQTDATYPIVIASDIIAIATLIWGWPVVYKFFWMPKLRAAEREARLKERKQKRK
jgi:hypothetical protein